MKVHCISDLHGFLPKLPGGELLIIAGDLTAMDTVEEHADFVKWLSEQDYDKIIVVPGNHDNKLENEDLRHGLYSYVGIPHVDMLVDRGVEYEGLKVWGSPWTLRFHGQNPDCMAFTVGSEVALEHKFAQIPDDTDILVTHGPAFGTLDKCWHARCGSHALAERIDVIIPRLHVFGHIHSSHGKVRRMKYLDEKKEESNVMISVNAAIMDEVYDPINKMIEVKL